MDDREYGLILKATESLHPSFREDIRQDLVVCFLEHKLYLRNQYESRKSIRNAIKKIRRKYPITTKWQTISLETPIGEGMTIGDTISSIPIPRRRMMDKKISRKDPIKCLGCRRVFYPSPWPDRRKKYCSKACSGVGRRSVSESTESFIVAQYKASGNACDVARKAGVSRDSVRRTLIRLGLK